MISQFKMIPINLLFVDDMYQRDLNEKRAQELNRDWEDDVVMPLLVNRRSNGTYSVIDGQHRLQRYKMSATEYVCCKVLNGKTVEEEARLFQITNKNRNAPTPEDLFKASLAAKDKLYLDIEQIVYKHGYDFRFISPTPNAPKNRTKSNQISAVGTLRRIAYDRNKTNGMDVLDETLGLIRVLWGNDKDALRGSMLSGIARFAMGIDNVENFNKTRFIELLQKKPAFEVLQIAGKYKLMYQVGEMEQNIVFALVEIYNNRLSEANKIKVGDILQTNRDDYIPRA